jgi:hypothetical protein
MQSYEQEGKPHSERSVLARHRDGPGPISREKQRHTAQQPGDASMGVEGACHIASVMRSRHEPAAIVANKDRRTAAASLAESQDQQWL